MALGDIGAFLPAESQYTRPGSYEAMLKAEAMKRAAWLASMDQFYDNLHEAQRQFNETLAFKKESFTTEHELATERLDLEREQLAAQKDYWAETIKAQNLRTRVMEGQTIAARQGALAEASDVDFFKNLITKQAGTGSSIAMGAYGAYGGEASKGSGEVLSGLSREDRMAYYKSDPSKNWSAAGDEGDDYSAYEDMFKVT